MVERLEATLATIGRLERFRGHLYNWYDTRDLRRLEPAYVSSVDSGNLAGHLLTLSNACRQMIDQPLPVAAALAGIGDAIALTRDAAGDDRRRPAEPDADAAPPRRGARAAARTAIEAPPRRPRRGRPAWTSSSAHARTLSDVAAALTAERGEGADSELVTWAEARTAGRRQPPSGPRAAAAARRERRRSRRIAELSDRRAGAGRRRTQRAAATLVRRLQAIADQADRLFREMDFSFLFDPTRKLFSIGFRVCDGDARSELLRPARLRGAPGQLPRDRQGRRRRRTTGSGSAAR